MKLLNSTIIATMLLLACATSANAQGGVWKGFKSGVRSAVDKGPTKAVSDVIDSAAGMVGANKGNKKPGSGGSGGNGGNGSGGNGRYVSKHKDCDPGPQPDGAGDFPVCAVVSAEVSDLCWLCVTDSYDGVFAIPNESNRRWRFYRTDNGKQIGDGEWKAAEEPHFNGGVCAVQNPDTKQWTILKKDGSTIALDKNIASVTNFMDGVAIATSTSYRHFYINDKGQKVYPTAVPARPEIYPLIDGTRRLFCGNGGYGYLDARGNIIIKPVYEEARNFGSGVAIVFSYTATQNKYWVIDAMGKKVSEVPEQYAKVSWTKTCNLGDFAGSATVAKNNSTGKYDIINTKMKVLASFDNASPFCRLRTPAQAQVCVVWNKDWTHPKFCNTLGVLLNYGNPPQPGIPPTEPWYETSNEKGEKTVRKPYINDDPIPNNQVWSASRWEFSGICFAENGITDTGYVMNYEGLMRIFDRRYETPENYSIDGYAKCIKRSHAGWRVVGCRWVEQLKEHTVFINRSGQVTVEVIGPKREL